MRGTSNGESVTEKASIFSLPFSFFFFWISNHLSNTSDLQEVKRQPLVEKKVKLYKIIVGEKTKMGNMIGSVCQESFNDNSRMRKSALSFQGRAQNKQTKNRGPSI